MWSMTKMYFQCLMDVVSVIVWITKKKKNILETVLSPVFNYLIDHSSWQPVS